MYLLLVQTVSEYCDALEFVPGRNGLFVWTEWPNVVVLTVEICCVTVVCLLPYVFVYCCLLAHPVFEKMSCLTALAARCPFVLNKALIAFVAFQCFADAYEAK